MGGGNPIPVGDDTDGVLWAPPELPSVIDEKADSNGRGGTGTTGGRPDEIEPDD
jgi:hypothetical protein